MRKIKKALAFAKRTVDDFRVSRHFSYYYACLRACERISKRLGLHRFSRKFSLRKNRWITEYLEKELASVVEAYGNNTEQGTNHENAPIWICWWTGIETAPELVQRCVESIYQNAGEHPVHLITKDNYCKYLEIPQFILSKLESRSMCIANFTDYLRFSLLEQYGGIWLDATIFCASSIPENYFTMPLFSCKGGVDTGVYISRYRWTAFCFGGFKDHILFKFFRSTFESYWRKNDTAIDYLLVDYIINLGYENNSVIRQDLDAIPLNNLARDDLQTAMNAALPASQFETVLQKDTVLYKLSWREQYSKVAENGEKSVYGYFIRA